LPEPTEISVVVGPERVDFPEGRLDRDPVPGVLIGVFPTPPLFVPGLFVVEEEEGMFTTWLSGRTWETREAVWLETVVGLSCVPWETGTRPRFLSAGLLITSLREVMMLLASVRSVWVIRTLLTQVTELKEKLKSRFPMENPPRMLSRTESGTARSFASPSIGRAWTPWGDMRNPAKIRRIKRLRGVTREGQTLNKRIISRLIRAGLMATPSPRERSLRGIFLFLALIFQ
jgi:hypothetical protein